MNLKVEEERDADDREDDEELNRRLSDDDGAEDGECLPDKDEELPPVGAFHVISIVEEAVLLSEATMEEARFVFS